MWGISKGLLTYQSQSRFFIHIQYQIYTPKISTCLQIAFNPQGTKLLTASADKTAKVWDPMSGTCLQALEGHTDEIFSCAFNYEGDTVITGKEW